MRSGTVTTPQKFTGQRLDSTGLYYYGARYYDSTIGRFISADTIVPNPANPQSLNRYSYCLNNPLKYIDPSGHKDEEHNVLVTGYQETNSSGVFWYTIEDNGNLVGIATGEGELEEKLGIYNEAKGITSGGEKLTFDKSCNQFPSGDAYLQLLMLGMTGTLGTLGNLGFSNSGQLPIGSTGLIGENAIKKYGGRSNVYFSTEYGARFVDEFVGSTAMEAKTGKTYLTNFIKSQIQKDVALRTDVKSGVEQVEWHFYKSPITGEIGPSEPLRAALNGAGIKIVIEK